MNTNRTLQGTDGDLGLKRYVNVNCLEHQATKFYAVVVVLLSEVVKGHKRPFRFFPLSWKYVPSHFHRYHKDPIKKPTVL